MTGFPKWLTPAALVVCLAVVAVQTVRASRLSYRVSVAERARAEADENRVKNLEPIIRNQRYELTRLRLQLKAIGSPPLPYISGEEVDRAENEIEILTKTLGPAPANRKLPPRPPAAVAE